MKLTGKNRSTPGKTCPSATLSTTNPTWTDPGSNLGLRGGRPATDGLSHGTALRSTVTLMSALDGVGGQSHAPAALTPGKRPGSIVQEAWWTPGPVWCGTSRHRDT
jgi:hypothetical protein